MAELRLTNPTSPLSRFTFSYVILMWSQWELLFTLICEAGALEPSKSDNYTIIFTKYHTTNKCTNCMSFILNHYFKTLSLLLHVSMAYRLSSSGSTYSS